MQFFSSGVRWDDTPSPYAQRVPGYFPEAFFEIFHVPTFEEGHFTADL